MGYVDIYHNSIGAIRSNLATSCDDWRCRQTEVTINTATYTNRLFDHIDPPVNCGQKYARSGTRICVGKNNLIVNLQNKVREKELN